MRRVPSPWLVSPTEKGLAEGVSKAYLRGRVVTDAETPAMHRHATLLTRFYEAFQKRDAVTMGACYHAEAHFSDPVFQRLNRDETVAMWAMLCRRARDFDLQFSNIQADGANGKAHWEARYTFSKTGRSVHNRIDAQFTFADGLILSHADTFDLWRWAGMALGPMGTLLGWTPLVQNKIRQEARQALEVYMKRHT